MMYNEFLEITGLTESDVSMSQYQFDVEPAYTFIYAWENKQEFCDFYKAAGHRAVCEISANIMRRIAAEKKVDALIDQNAILRERLAGVRESMTVILSEADKIISELQYD